MRRPLALLLPPLLALALTLPGISRPVFRHEDEWRNLVMTREMNVSGPALFPRLHGNLYPDYPPFYFWLALAGTRAQGEVGPFAARLPAAIGAALIALATAILGTRLSGPRLGLHAGLLTCVLPGLWYEETRAMIDPLFAGLTTLAVALVATGLREREERGGRRALRLAGGFVALALAWLTKGPLGAVVVLLALAGGEGLVLLLTRETRAKAFCGKLAAVALASLVVATLWYGLAYATEGREFGSNLLVTQTLRRFLRHTPKWLLALGFPEITGTRQHEKPWQYFFQVVPILLPGLAFALGEAWLVSNRRPRTRAAAFALGWLAVLFLFFSLSNTKRSYYLMPAYPAVGLLAACFFERAGDDPRIVRRVSLTAIASLLWIAAAIAPFLRVYYEDLGAVGFGLAASFALGAGTLVFFMKRGKEAAGLALAVAFVLAGIQQTVVPLLEAQHGHAELAAKLRDIPRDAIAVSPGGIHREALCWELAPVHTGLPNLLSKRPEDDHADPEKVLAFLRRFPPGKAAVILKGDDATGALGPETNRAIRKVYRSDDEPGALVAIELKGEGQ